MSSIAITPASEVVEQLVQQGLPQSLERFPLTKLKNKVFVPAVAQVSNAVAANLEAYPHRIVFAGGKFSSEYTQLPEGVSVYTEKEAGELFSGYKEWFTQKFEGIDQGSFASLAAPEHGAFIVIEETLSEPLALVHVLAEGEEETPFSSEHIEVMVTSNASVTLTRYYEGSLHHGWHHTEMRVGVQAGGKCRLIDEGQGFSSSAVKTVNISTLVNKEGLFDGVCLSEGGLGVFTRVRGLLLEERASGSYRCLSLLKTGTSHWQDIAFYHVGEGTLSHQLVRNMVEDKAFSSFAGRIDVDEKAQQTDAYQRNENILLGEKAMAFAYPGLEIRADDVKASHGCTTSELDKSSAFYLHSRGIDKQRACALMIEGFCYSFRRDEDRELSKDRLANFIKGFIS